MLVKEKKRKIAKSCPTLVIPSTVACQAPLSMGFSKSTSNGASLGAQWKRHGFDPWSRRVPHATKPVCHNY